jgi:hypothetical protein
MLVPHRNHLFLDRIHGTVDIPSASRRDLRDALEGRAFQEEVSRESNRNSRLLKDYRYAYWVPMGASGHMTIQLDPRVNSIGAGGSNFLRIETNPQRNTIPVFRAIENIISPVMRVDERWFIQRFSPTRLDLTFDVIGLDMEDFDAFHLLRRTTTTRFQGADGRLNGLYFGQEGENRLVVYDKAEHLRIVRNSHVFRHCRDSRAGRIPLLRRTRLCTRFELCLRRYRSFAAIAGLPNQFSRYTVRELRAMAAGARGYAFAWLTDSAKQRGLQAALSLIANQRERDGWRRAVQDVEQPRWWDPVAIWGEWPTAVGSALGVSPALVSRGSSGQP